MLSAHPWLRVFVKRVGGKNRYRSGLGSSRGMAAIEFALVLPVLLLMVVGSFDAAMATILRSEVSYAADEIGLATTAQAYSTSTLNDVTPTNADTAMSMVYAVVPMLRIGLSSLSSYSVTLTGVSFGAGVPTNCVDPNCTYPANVNWVAELDLGANPTIPVAASALSGICVSPWTPLTPATASTAQTTWTGYSSSIYHNIPTIVSQTTTNGVTSSVNMSGLGNTAILVTDVSLVYKPLFLKFLTGPVTLSASSFQPPRSSTSTGLTYDATPVGGYTSSVAAITVDHNTSPPAVICNGYQ